MRQVTFATLAGERRAIDARPWQTLMEAAVEHGVDGAEAICARLCSWTTWRIYNSEESGADQPAAGLEGELLSALTEAPGRPPPFVRLQGLQDLEGLPFSHAPGSTNAPHIESRCKERNSR
jgi:hypothetical protein